MSRQQKSLAEKQAVEAIREYKQRDDVLLQVQRLRAGDRAALSSAITLLESRTESHRQKAEIIIDACLPHSGKSLRIGITGVPGVGKSTFIDAFGTMLTSLGKKVAVLAIDPTSPVSRGSILGDKTRMSNLSNNPNAFIRPSPSSQSSGGVAHRTREAILLCEAAGFDIIIVETVGVGQGEIAVHGMTDFFMLLMLAGAGDQLQGIKRGIIEMADSIFITKADSGNEKNSLRARAEYASALHLFPADESGWAPRVEVVSSQLNRGIEVAWNIVTEFEQWMKTRSLFQQRRQQQDVRWMHEALDELTREKYLGDEKIQRKIREMEQLVLEQKLSPFEAARRIVQ